MSASLVERTILVLAAIATIYAVWLAEEARESNKSLLPSGRVSSSPETKPPVASRPPSVTLHSKDSTSTSIDADQFSDPQFAQPDCTFVSELMGKKIAVLRVGMKICTSDETVHATILEILNERGIWWRGRKGGDRHCASSCEFYGTSLPRFDFDGYAPDGDHYAARVRFRSH